MRLLKSWSRVTELEWMYSQRRYTTVWTINWTEWGSRLTAVRRFQFPVSHILNTKKHKEKEVSTLCPLRTNPHFWNYVVKQTSELEEYSDYIVSTENQPALLELLWSKQVNWKSTVTILCPLRTNPHFWNYCEANQWTGRVQWLYCFHWEPTRTFGTILWSKQANWKSTATYPLERSTPSWLTPEYKTSVWMLPSHFC